ncbi:another transcription unit protein-like [Drosophila sulfurigaster albostrigata]|uniref:another transcription unit protein-like n=1 Tax=Drosophila sulfurigaster albostrigata TaxID=89887 RepID=UPI002D21EDE4|nr:another transcription unit protein-like [Drosophila sulfurigaster albostrigata]
MDKKKKLQSFSDAGNCSTDCSLGAVANRPRRSLSSSSSGESSKSGGSSSDSDSSDNEHATENKCADLENIMSDAETIAVFRMDEYFREKYLDRLAVEFKSEWPEIDSDLAASQPSLMRMPNFMPFDQKPYGMLDYKDEASKEDLRDCELREAFLTKLKTTVRWREIQNATGEVYQESNARIVRWSDGSQTFHVGAEAFDVVRMPLSGTMNQFYLRSGNYYKLHCPIKEKLTLRPKLDSSFGMSHVQGMRQRAIYKPSTTSGVKILPDLTTNPIVERDRKIREESANQRREWGRQRYSSVQPLQHYSSYKSNN